MIEIEIKSTYVEEDSRGNVHTSDAVGLEDNVNQDTPLFFFQLPLA